MSFELEYDKNDRSVDIEVWSIVPHSKDHQRSRLLCQEGHSSSYQGSSGRFVWDRTGDFAGASRRFGTSSNVYDEQKRTLIYVLDSLYTNK